MKTIKIDYDYWTWHQVKSRSRNMSRIWREHHGIVVKSLTLERRGWHHWHLLMEVIGFDDDKDVLIFQLAMGSCARRESWNWSRLGQLDDWNYFYDGKKVKGRKQVYHWDAMRSKELAEVWE